MGKNHPIIPGLGVLAVVTGIHLCFAGLNDDPALIHHWPLDETSGTVANDIVGGNHGNFVGTPQWVPGGGQVNGACHFSGKYPEKNYIDAGTFDIVSEAGLTIALWVKIDTFAMHDHRFISKTTSPMGGDHYWMISTGSSRGSELNVPIYPRFRLKAGGEGTGDGSTTTMFGDLDTLLPGTWYHIAGLYDVAEEMMMIYVNGDTSAYGWKSGPINANPAVKVAIGNNPFYGTSEADDASIARNLIGSLDDIRIYTRPLARAELQELVGSVGLYRPAFYISRDRSPAGLQADPMSLYTPLGRAIAPRLRARNGSAAAAGMYFSIVTSGTHRKAFPVPCK